MVKCLSCPNESYIGETSKDSAVAGHIRETGHSFNLDNPDILCFESGYITKRKIKEAVFIQEHNPSLNTLINKFYPIHYMVMLEESVNEITNTYF